MMIGEGGGGEGECYSSLCETVPDGMIWKVVIPNLVQLFSSMADLSNLALLSLSLNLL